MKTKSVLIVDDDLITRQQLEKELKRNFFTTFLAYDGKSTLEIFDKEDIDILILDVKLPDVDGLDVLQTVKEKKPECEVIIVTGFGTQEIAIQALRRGAIDYIEKPIKMEELYTSLGRAQEKLTALENLAYKNTLLLIDDEVDIVRRLGRFLEKEGYEVFCANGGREGLEIIEKNKIDIVITDIRMKDMDGLEVLKRAKNIYRDIEGIVITGSMQQDAAIKSLRAGAVDYITKPISLDALLFSVKKAISTVNLNRNKLYRNRELKITAEIISKMNEELERRIKERTQELSQIQSQLFQTSKLATLGEMSTGLAHEMNQPLGGIALVAKNLRKLKERDKLTFEEIDSGLTDIESSVKRMSKIIQHIRTFARQEALKFSEVAINDTVDSAMSLLWEQLRLHEIDVTLNLADNLPLINGEPYQLEQVWINLITNARDAMEERGKSSEDYRKEMTISTSYDPELKVIKVSFRDNGVGIASEKQEKVLEPFFTTKEVGKATGLGLSISYGIVESHKGKIEIKSKENEGAEISVSLPVKT